MMSERHIDDNVNINAVAAVAMFICDHLAR